PPRRPRPSPPRLTSPSSVAAYPGGAAAFVASILPDLALRRGGRGLTSGGPPCPRCRWRCAPLTTPAREPDRGAPRRWRRAGFLDSDAARANERLIFLHGRAASPAVGGLEGLAN